MKIHTIIEGGAMVMGQWPNYRHPTPNEAFSLVGSGDVVKLPTPNRGHLFVSISGCWGETQYADGVPETPAKDLDCATTWHANSKMRHRYNSDMQEPQTIINYRNRQ